MFKTKQSKLEKLEKSSLSGERKFVAFVWSDHLYVWSQWTGTCDSVGVSGTLNMQAQMKMNIEPIFVNFTVVVNVVMNS